MKEGDTGDDMFILESGGAAAERFGQVRCVWSLRHHPPGKYWRFPFKLPKSGADISKRIVDLL